MFYFDFEVTGSLLVKGGRTRELGCDLNDLQCFIPALPHLSYFKGAVSPFPFRVAKVSGGLSLWGSGYLCLVLRGLF